MTNVQRHVVLGRSSRHGRGVFAATALAPGTVVEIAPVLILSRVDGDAQDLLARYLFEWDVDEDVTAYALALGWGSLFNHSGDPSCVYTRADDDELVGPGVAPALIFTTARAVVAREELTIDYSGTGVEDFNFGV
jgi:uncharacterized protein